MAADDSFSPTCSRTLDHSEQLYTYSPSSSVSPGSEHEATLALREEIKELEAARKTLKEQCQRQEDAFIQEQIEKEDIEKRLRAEIHRLETHCMKLQKDYDCVKSLLDEGDQERINLQTKLEQYFEENRKQKVELANLKTMVPALHQELEDNIQLNSKYISEINSLKLEQNKLRNTCNDQEDQLKDLEESLQKCVAEKEELFSQLHQALTIQRSSSPFEDKFELNNNLESEMKIFNFVTKADKSVVVTTTLYPGESQMETVHEKIALSAEIQAAESLLESEKDLDCSFDHPQDFSSPDTSQFLSLTPDKRGIVRNVEGINTHPSPHVSCVVNYLTRPDPRIISSSSPERREEPDAFQQEIFCGLPKRIDQSVQTTHAENQIKTLGPTPFAETVLSPTAYKSMWCRALTALTIGICLVTFLVYLAILITAATLEIAAESRALTYPYSGSIPHWLKRIVRPFIRIRRTPVPV